MSLEPSMRVYTVPAVPFAIQLHGWLIRDLLGGSGAPGLDDLRRMLGIEPVFPTIMDAEPLWWLR
jgi:hypothetical protein